MYTIVAVFRKNELPVGKSVDADHWSQSVITLITSTT